MILRTAKGFYSADTFAALADHQFEFQGAFAVIEIGGYSVDVDSADESAEDMARIVLAEIDGAIFTLGLDADDAGDTEQVRLCDAAIKGDIAALEACCAVFCAVAAQD